MANKKIEFVDEETGVRTVYTYRENIQRGLKSVEVFYPKSYSDELDRKVEIEEKLPKTKRMYMNPATGREVSYYRAKALRLVD